MRTAITIALGCSLLCFAACQKDELTVTSTASAHVCAHLALTLNVDSLLHNDPYTPEVSICTCDTLVITPTNFPADISFVEWSIDQGIHHSTSDHPVLDTLTVSSELMLVLHEDIGGLFIQVPVVVHVGPC